MRCPECGSPLVTEREWEDKPMRDMPDYTLFYTCHTAGCVREDDRFGPAEDDGPNDMMTGPGAPDGRASMKDAGRLR